MSTTDKEDEEFLKRQKEVEETNRSIDLVIEDIKQYFRKTDELHKESLKSIDERLATFDKAISKERNKDKKNLLILAKRHFGFEKHTLMMTHALVADVSNLREMLCTNAKTLNILVGVMPDISKGYEAKKTLDDSFKKYGEAWEALNTAWENAKQSKNSKVTEENGVSVYG
jgi:ClpP class serine protease